MYIVHIHKTNIENPVLKCNHRRVRKKNLLIPLIENKGHIYFVLMTSSYFCRLVSDRYDKIMSSYSVYPKICSLKQQNIIRKLGYHCQ